MFIQACICRFMLAYYIDMLLYDFFNLSLKVYMRVWMIKVFIVNHRSDISSYPCDWSSVLYFTLILKANLISVLVKELWLHIVGNDLNQMCTHMGTNFVKSLIFFVIKTTRSRAPMLECKDSGTLSQMSIVSKFISYQFTWICVKGMWGI